jgi:hypothetical protein
LFYEVAGGERNVMLIIPASANISMDIVSRIRKVYPRLTLRIVDDTALLRRRKFFRYLYWVGARRIASALLSIAGFDQAALRQSIEESVEIFIFNDSLFVSELVMNNSVSVSLMEEGSVNYLCEKELYSRLELILLDIMRAPKRMGRNSKINLVYAQDIVRLPKELQRKAIGVDMSLSVLSESSLNNLFESFVDDGTIFACQRVRKRITLIVMQDLAICGLSSDECVLVYQFLADAYSSDSKVYIKPHPNDEKDYSLITNVALVPGYIPLELVVARLTELASCGVKGVSLIKSSISNTDFKDLDVIFADISILEQLSRQKILSAIGD